MLGEIEERTDRESGVGRRTFLWGATVGVASAVASGVAGPAAMAWSKSSDRGLVRRCAVTLPFVELCVDARKLRVLDPKHLRIRERKFRRP